MLLRGYSDEFASGMPFTQLILCSAINTSLTYTVPYGTVGYFNPSVTSCPTNWTAFDEVSDSTPRGVDLKGMMS